MKKELILKAKQLKLEGYSVSSIAKQLNVKRTSISYYLNKDKVNKNLDINYIIKLYNSGNSITDIQNKLNISYWELSKIINSSNVVIRDANYKRQYQKEDPFKNIDNPITQYWLGYIASDGSVSTKGNTISLYTNIDKDFLLKNYYTNFLNNKACVYNKQTLNISFSNKDTKCTLINLGITPNKTFTLKYSYNINWDFVRGVFDGDGCISSEGACFITTASKDFANQLTDFFDSKNIIYSLYKKTKTTYNIYIWKKSRESFAKGLYNNSVLYLPRKYNKFKDKNIV